ncbi:MAG: hypothetical protein ACXWBL_03560, partial [Usitatibacter sp.]
LPHSRLFYLFEPEDATRRHFAILAATLNRPSVSSKIVHGTMALLGNFAIAALIGAIPGALLLYSVDRTNALWLVPAVIGLVLVAAGAILNAARSALKSLLKALPAQEFGLSRGYRKEDEAASPALVNWLHGYIQELSGKPSDQPLTFGDLEKVTIDERQDIKGIKLRMMTTALSMGRPYSIPFTTNEFYFLEEELARYFPPAVVAWMKANPGERTNPARDEAMKGFGYLPFPAHETLPVVVATRMSLSFPGLLSAVPLYRDAWETRAARRGLMVEAVAPEDDASEEAAPRFSKDRGRRVVFSDGGICSNFPIHMFDSMLPGWPTFGINLRDDLAPGAERAYLPRRGGSLPPESYAIGDREAGAGDFIVAIVNTMQNWRDNLQRAAPGFRDRIVTVSHTPQEGGLNLDMDADAIKRMSESGTQAAEALVAGFAAPASFADDRWTYHRWVRVRSLLCVMQQGLGQVHDGITSTANLPPYPDLVLHSQGYVGGSYRMTDDARGKANEIFDALSKLSDERVEAAVDFSANAPKPAVELRIQPVL